MTKNLRATLVVVGVAVVLAVGAFLLFRPTTPAEAPQSGELLAAQATDPALLVREDSHVLSSAPADAPAFVEFLDFECPSCAGAYPAVEQLREEYGDRVRFVVRYFPIPSHANAEASAVAAEAAAQQGRFEEMYHALFQTQSRWANLGAPQPGVFREIAATIGLDLTAYDAAVADPATLERVLGDQADGIDAGVTGTPSFFLDDRLVGPATVDDLRVLLDETAAP